MRDSLHTREMTVAQIREPEHADYVQVVFLESARFYKLMKDNPGFDRALKLLRDALINPRLLLVSVASLDSDLIQKIGEPG